MKVLVIGGGIAGLAIAWRLARAGIAVEVVERGICGRGASWAAAGMIAPGGELNGADDALTRFAREARELWPGFAAELEQASGARIDYRESSSLIVAETEAQADHLRAAAGSAAHWLNVEHLLACEPLLSPTLAGGLRVCGDAQADNRAVCEALYRALTANAIVVHENCEAQSLVIERGSARAILTSRGTMDADAIVLASGAWMQMLAGPGIDLPDVRPIKGQMAALLPPNGVALPKSLVWCDDVYLVAQRGMLLIGATVEDAGFDTSVERQQADRLLRAASQLVPSLAKWRLAEVWAGLRPRTADDAPVLGPASMQNLYVAGGQFRNGILFAPAVAEYMAKFVCGQRPSPLAAAFDPNRFTQSL
jgi:glycine oxidase